MVVRKFGQWCGVLVAVAALSGIAACGSADTPPEVAVEEWEPQTEEDRQASKFYDLVMDKGIDMPFGTMSSIGHMYCEALALTSPAEASSLILGKYVAEGFLSANDSRRIESAAESAYCPELA